MEFNREMISRSALTEPINFSLDRVGGKLRPYQAAGVEEIISRGGSALLADDMGIGKTIQALAFIDETHACPALIVCRANMVATWAIEARKWCPWAIVETIRDGNSEPYWETDIVITNYELLIQSDTEESAKRKKELKTLLEDGKTSKTAVKREKAKLGKKDRAISAWAKRVKPMTLILDEAHGIKNREAQCTKQILEIRKGAKYAILLTGTPILNRPDEIGPLIECIDPTFNVAKQKAIMNTYCLFREENVWTNYGRRKRRVAIGLKYGDGFNEYLRGTVMIRRTANQVLKDLPPLIESTIVLDHPELVSMANDEASIYDMVEEMRKRAEECTSIEDACVGSSRSIEIKKLAQARKNLGERKIPAAIEFIKRLCEEKPRVLVFAHHRDVIRKITEGLDDSASYFGETTKNDREKIIESFRKGETKVLVTGIQAGGTGITLAECDTIVWVELPWVPALVDQGNARCRRIGCIASSVLVYYIVVRNSIDARMANRLTQKEKMAQQALGWKEEEVEDEGNEE